MTNIPTMRRGALMIALAGVLLLQGCAMPQSSALGTYSGEDYVAALDSVMTTDQGGE